MAFVTSEGPAGPNQERVFLVDLADWELGLLASIPDQLEAVLMDPELSPPVIDRLFPDTFPDDPAEEAEYRRLLGDTLMESRRDGLAAFRRSLEPFPVRRDRTTARLAEPALTLWLQVINDFRLLLGTLLDIRDNEWSLRGPEREEDETSFQMLLATSAIQEVVIDALSSA